MYREALGHRHSLAHRNRLRDRQCVVDGSGLLRVAGGTAANLDSGKVPLGVGANTTIQRAIVDKNARIGRNVQIVNQDKIQESTREELGFVIRNGIVVIIKNATIPDGTVI